MYFCTNLTHAFTLAFALLLLVSCGGSGKSYPEHKIFGKVLASQLEFRDQDSALVAKRTPKSMKENREKRDQVREQLFNAIEREKATVVGHDIPFEVDPNAGFEVTSCKIADLGKSGEIYVNVKVELTDPLKARILPFSPDEMFISWRILDADGHVMHGDMASPIQLDQEAAPGAIGETNFGLGNFSSNANDYYRFGKVSFRTEK